MARPPRQIFQRMQKSISETTEKIKKDVVKYFLLFYIFTELLSFLIEMINPQLYYDIIFYVMVQAQMFVLFLFLLHFNFCQRNKIIIYFLLIYLASNIFMPFYCTNGEYTEIIRNITMLLLTFLLSLTLFNSNVKKK